MSITSIDLMVNKTNLSETQWMESTLPDDSKLQPGQALLKIDEFSVTANNISYGVLGEAFGYWDFFPAPEGFGRIPVWGFADVVASTVDGVEVGSRVYGYLPMSQYLVIEPGHVTPVSMMDSAAHRQQRSPIYNQYTFTSNDPAYSKAHEGLISLFRPLFTTSFLLDVFHAQQDFFGAQSLVLTSASSKTAIGLASLLAKRKGQVTVVGLTSDGNKAFVESLGYYDQVVAYGNIESLPKVATASVDMAGNSEVLARIHQHFGDELKKSSLIGATHWDERTSSSSELPGPAPEIFFAPGFAQEVIQDWGMDKFQSEVGAAWMGFIPQTESWITIQRDRGQQAVLDVYKAVLGNNSNPSIGHIVSMWD